MRIFWKKKNCRNRLSVAPLAHDGYPALLLPSTITTWSSSFLAHKCVLLPSKRTKLLQ